MALLTIPKRVHSIDEMFGTIKQLEGVQNVVSLIEDESGVWVMVIDGPTAERINWMLDRAKLLVHGIV